MHVWRTTDGAAGEKVCVVFQLLAPPISRACHAYSGASGCDSSSLVAQIGIGWFRK